MTKKLHIPTFSDDDISQLATAAVKQVANQMRAEAKPHTPNADPMLGQVFEEAYVAQNKSYSMTTGYLSEPAKKNHEQIYKNYTEILTRVSVEVDSVDKENISSAHSQYRSVKKDEIYNLNAVYLHELFFANCFDPNSELFQDSNVFMYVSRDWGTFDMWMKDFMAAALASRSGWVICGYSLFLKRFINVSVDSHDQGMPAGIIPILVIDMWEHAYVRDYGSDKKAYLTAMMREISWDVVEDRVNRVTSVKEVMG